MQTANARYFALTTLFLISIGLYAALGQAPGTGRQATPRWPSGEAVFLAGAWTTGPAQVEHHTDASSNTDLVTRIFTNQARQTATLTLITSEVPRLYGAGAEVPFLGNGYTSGALPASVARFTKDGIAALVAERGTERWLVMYAFGERRGLLGNGPVAWTLALFDGLSGRTNDYYKLYLAERWDSQDGDAAESLAELAHVTFMHIAEWYGEQA